MCYTSIPWQWYVGALVLIQHKFRARLLRKLYIRTIQCVIKRTFVVIERIDRDVPNDLILHFKHMLLKNSGRNHPVNLICVCFRQCLIVVNKFKLCLLIIALKRRGIVSICAKRCDSSPLVLNVFLF